MDLKRPALILGDGEMATQFYLDFGHELEVNIEGFIQDHDSTEEERRLEGLPVYSLKQSAPLARTHGVFSVLGAEPRARFVEGVEALGFESIRVIHQGAVISPHCEIGAGSCIYPGVGIAARARLGRHVLAARTIVIGHGSTIGDYTTVSSGCMISGNVHIGRECYLGMGAVLAGKFSVGDRALIGAGSVVIRDVPAGAKVVGNPGRVIGYREFGASGD